VRLYWEVGKRGFRRYSTYRAATVAGVITNSVFGLIRAYILIAVFRQRTTIGSFDVTDAITFTFVTQGLLMPVGAFGRMEIAERIRTGDVVADLYRPVDFQAYWLAHDLGRAAFELLARGIPPVLFGAIVFHLRLPHTLTTWLAFMASLAVAVIVSFGLTFMVNLTAFWLIDDRGANQLSTAIQLFLSGILLPIVLFPHWLEVIARNSPFAATVQLPVEVLLAKHPGASLLPVLTLQLLWAVGLLGLGRVVLAAATRKVVIQGG
jgi:ABC-2 type transport system permease protein